MAISFSKVFDETLPINHKKIPKTHTSPLNGVEDGSGANLAVALAEFT